MADYYSGDDSDGSSSDCVEGERWARSGEETLGMTTGVGNLPSYCSTFSTGPMGDCVAVVVLWNDGGGPLPDGSFGHVRGHHGFGGAQAVQFGKLAEGVPTGARVVVMLGSVATQTQDIWRGPLLVEKYFPGGIYELRGDCGLGTVDCWGNVTGGTPLDWDGAKARTDGQTLEMYGL